MLAQKTGGSIVTITAALAANPIAGVTASVPMITKGGLDTITKHLAMEYAKDGIRFNAVAPGVVDTPLHKNDPKEVLLSLNPMGVLSSVADIVDAVMYLTEAHTVTGEILNVDGGAHIGPLVIERSFRHDHKLSVRRGPACQARHQAPGAAGAVWHLRGSGADGQSAFSDRDASHGRPRGEIHWARRRGARCGSGAQGGSPRGAQRPRGCEAAFGIARQGDADRPARRVDGHFGRCPRSAESR